MEAFRTHGAFSWSELTTSDPAAAAEFYGKLLGWQVKAPDATMGGYRVINNGDAGIGGITSPFPGAPAAPPHWGFYVTVDKVDELAARCTELGGKVLVPPMDIPNVGRMVVIQDPQGAVINLITYNLPA
jgi:predicted enzyme related to lactoylglutathione lyase